MLEVCAEGVEEDPNEVGIDGDAADDARRRRAGTTRHRRGCGRFLVRAALAEVLLMLLEGELLVVLVEGGGGCARGGRFGFFPDGCEDDVEVEVGGGCPGAAGGGNGDGRVGGGYGCLLSWAGGKGRVGRRCWRGSGGFMSCRRPEGTVGR